MIREIGQGGFGVVYLARDPALGRDVALKVPRAEVLMTPDARRRFLREGRAAAGLDHPYIIPVFEAGEIGPFAYIVSAYCEGPTLSAWLRERAGPVPARAAALLIAGLADAVQHAHDRGVLHRDLKPSNILLQRGEDPDAPIPRITDFGLARIIEEAGDGRGDAERRPVRLAAVHGAGAGRGQAARGRRGGRRLLPLARPSTRSSRDARRSRASRTWRRWARS